MKSHSLNTCCPSCGNLRTTTQVRDMASVQSINWPTHDDAFGSTSSFYVVTKLFFAFADVAKIQICFKGRLRIERSLTCCIPHPR